MSLRLRFQAGVAWNMASAVMTQGSLFLANVIIANFLGRNVFGEFSMTYNTLITFAGIAQMYMGVAATKYVAELRSVDKVRAGRVLGLCTMATLVTGLAATLLLAGASSWLAPVVLKAPQLIQPLVIGSLFVLLSAASGYQQGALAGLESYRTLATISLLHSAFHVLISAGMAWVWGLEGAVASLVLSGVLRWFMLDRAIRREAEIQGIVVICRGAWQESKMLERFVLPATLAGLWGLPAWWIANAFLARQPDGFTQIGLYAAANSIRLLVLFLPGMLSSVALSLLSNQLGLGDQRQYRRVFWTSAAVNAASVIAGAVVVAVAGQWLLGWYGAGFVDAYPALLLLVASTIFEGLALVAYQVLSSKERVWVSLLIAVPRDALLLGAALLLVVDHGAVGLAGAYLIAWIFGCAAVYWAAISIGLEIRRADAARVEP